MRAEVEADLGSGVKRALGLVTGVRRLDIWPVLRQRNVAEAVGRLRFDD